MQTIDFRGFRFGKNHTSDMKIEVVSTQDRYKGRVLPSPSDKSEDIPGSDGKYYFGSLYKTREFSCSIAFDNLSEQDYRRIRQIFSTDKLQDLVFDEEPYKTWKAKVKTAPDFKHICFTDAETGLRVYKGEGQIDFICYYPYAFGFKKYLVQAADYYALTPPECIIAEAATDETFIKSKKNKESFSNVPQDIKYQYNVNPSDYEGGATVKNVNEKRYRDKSHRNKRDKDWDTNNGIWKTGFPTYEQVVQGELYFDTPDGEKTIIDVRNYWDNVPKWQCAAKLLTSPTLDFEQELIYLPQYSKTDFINMETGFQSTRPIIGSRLLVYNPGDLPVEWELKFNENKRGFWSSRGGQKFRIQRFNVQRLNLEDAVDWCGLKTYKEEDNVYFKYGTKYFLRRGSFREALLNFLRNTSDASLPKIYKAYEDRQDDSQNDYYSREELIQKVQSGILPFDKEWSEGSLHVPYTANKSNHEMVKYDATHSNNPAKTSFNTHLNDEWSDVFHDEDDFIRWLGEAHPTHCYYVEPIPKELLGHYIKLFYWQTIQWRGERDLAGNWIATERYKEFLKDYLDEDGRIKDIDNPLIQMAKMFADFIVDTDTETVRLITSPDNSYREIYKDLDFQEGLHFAERYEELYHECISDDERYELYWKTLFDLLKRFSPMIQKIHKEEEAINKKTDIDEAINKFIYSYVNCPPEFLSSDMRDLNYGEDIFNGYKMPTWLTPDYMEIDQSLLSGVDIIKNFMLAMEEDYKNIFVGERRQYTETDRQKLIEKKKYSALIKTLDSTIGVGGFLNDLLDDEYYLNTDKRMLYTNTNNNGNEFDYMQKKVLMNNAIIKGKWFKLPPGWSLLSIEPIIDETAFGGKRWEDARPFDWGYGGDINRNKREVQQLFDFVHDLAKQEFLDAYSRDKIVDKIIPMNNLLNDGDLDGELIKFKVWYEKQKEFHLTNNNGKNYFAQSLYNKYASDGEYQFLKTINSIWSAISGFFSWSAENGVFIDPDSEEELSLKDYDVTGLPLRCINADISDWWWYACNYLWANFPPLYWGAADTLNNIQVKYIPLFY